ncbi:MAG TPA: hypothetical protein VMF60_11005 [Acidimicrobiales bacterium]|nr:hypothetical protein [Acidimicrobiales bacterium]
MGATPSAGSSSQPPYSFADIADTVNEVDCGYGAERTHPGTLRVALGPPSGFLCGRLPFGRQRLWGGAGLMKPWANDGVDGQRGARA